MACDALESLIRELVHEARVREADIAGGGRTQWGSKEHMDDLERRIADMTFWRDRSKRGSASRENYARVLGRLKAELGSARRHATKGIESRTSMKEGKWWQDPALTDPDHPDHIGQDARYARFADDPEYSDLLDAIRRAKDPRDLARAKKTVLSAIDSGQTDLPDGVWMHFYEKRRDELKAMNGRSTSAKENRVDGVLRIRDSSGRARARR